MSKPTAKLTPRQAEFVRHYRECLNATEAARRAGYSPRSANVTASRLLSWYPHIREAIGQSLERPEKAWRNSNKQSVYLIREQYGAVKIGIAVSPLARLSHLQTSSPYALELIHHFRPDNAAEVEAQLHKRFASVRLSGEWFRLSEQQIADIVSKYPAKGGRACHSRENKRPLFASTLST